MRALLFVLISVAIALGAVGSPRFVSLNNHDNKVTVTLADDKAGGLYQVSEAKFINNYKDIPARSISTSVDNGKATIVLEFPHATQFIKPKIAVWINGNKHKIKIK